METVRYSSLGRKWLLTAAPEGLKNGSSLVGEDERIVLSPDLKYDFKLDIIGIGAPAFSDCMSALPVAAEFLFRKRGIPPTELDIATPCGVFTVEKRNGRISVVPPICKIKLSKETAIDNGVELSLYHVFAECELSVIRVGRLDCFELERLPSLSLLKGSRPLGAVAVCQTEESLLKACIYSPGSGESLSPPACAAAMIRCLSRGGGFSSDGEICVELSKLGRISFIREPTGALRYYAPVSVL